MRRFVFRPSWMFGHLLTVVAIVTCLRLADWQWFRFQATGSLQNWGYALQWPLFAVCFALGWWRMLRLESRRLDEEEGTEPEPSRPPAPAPVASKPGPAPEAAEDAELAAYNRMLAELAARDAQDP